MSLRDKMPLYVDCDGAGSQPVLSFTRFADAHDWYGWKRLNRRTFIYIRPNGAETDWEYKLVKVSRKR